MDRKYIIAILFVITFILLSNIIYYFGLNVTSDLYAQNGYFSLKDWDSKETPIIDLKGQWFYYPNRLLNEISDDLEGEIVSVPHFWGTDFESAKGYGVYKLTLTDLQPDKEYSFFMQDQVIAYGLYINGEKAASNGVVSDNEKDYIPQWCPVNGSFIADENGVAEISIEIANYDYNYGGFWNYIKMGNSQNIINYIVNRIIADLFLFLLILLNSIAFLLLYLYKRQEKSVLYFSLFSLCVSVRILFTGIKLIKRILPNLDWHIAIRIEYLSGYLLIPLFCLLILHFFHSNKYGRLKSFIKVIVIIISTVTLLLPHQAYIWFLNPYKYFAMILVIYFLVIILMRFKKDILYEILMLLALMNYTVAIIKEIQGGIISLIPIATFNFIICFSFIMLHRFSRFVKKNEMLAINASLDVTTGLHNRYYLNELSKNIFDNNKIEESIYVLFLDLDNFKDINDTYGHKIGDIVLQTVGQRLRKNIRNSDIICRYGGDEFVAIIKEDNIVDIHQITKRLIDTISEPIYIKEQTYLTGVSIGISHYPNQGTTLDELIKKSDHAMYIAKREGGNQFAWNIK